MTAAARDRLRVALLRALDRVGKTTSNERLADLAEDEFTRVLNLLVDDAPGDDEPQPSQANAGDFAEAGEADARDDPASRLAAGRTAAATSETRDATAGRDRQPAPATAAPPRADAKRDAEEAAIARFLADKGARPVLSPEQAAAFLRDCGHAATVREGADAGHGGPPVWRRSYHLAGREVAAAEFWAAVNRARAAGGLPPVAPPAEPENRGRGAAA